MFNTLARPGTDALLINGDLFLLSQREQLVALAARLALPAIYGTGRLTALVAGAFLSGTNTHGVRRALGALFKGAVSKSLPRTR